jgi:hypothetical protein
MYTLAPIVSQCLPFEEPPWPTPALPEGELEGGQGMRMKFELEMSCKHLLPHEKKKKKN